MKLKLTELEGKRQWVVALDDHELYELTCSQIAYRIWHQETSAESRKSIESRTVFLVEESRQPERAGTVEWIKDPFIRLILSEVNRLKIELP